MDVLIVGCGITGAVIAHELAGGGYDVTVIDRREHIGGNMYDYIDEHGIMVHKYGPHTFHTCDKYLYKYISQFGTWKEFYLKCGAVINGITTCTPFNYRTIDTYFANESNEIKNRIAERFFGMNTISVVEAINCEDELIRKYAEFLFENDYRPYSSKQWGLEPADIDSDILKRVPLRLSYEEGYFDDNYQFMPVGGYTNICHKILSVPNIKIRLNTEAKDVIEIRDRKIIDYNGNPCIVVYTGALDELFHYCFGRLPYRSLRFEWEYKEMESFQDYPVVAYPQEKSFTRITEYKKIPEQSANGTTYAIEYPVEADDDNEPYYPVITKNSIEIYKKYKCMAENIDNLYFCGRLADFKYYNMDEALKQALKVSQMILDEKSLSARRKI